MTEVHYRKAPTKKVLNFIDKTYYRTEAICGAYSEVPVLGKGMKHTDVPEDVTCEACLEDLGSVLLSNL